MSMPNKVVILAGGRGSRLAEETIARPKPMVEVGERPILWHIMKIYAAAGCRDFIICLGYKGQMIREYFLNYALYTHDCTISTHSNNITLHGKPVDDWRITLVDTGAQTQTGGRLKRVASYLPADRPFFFTYGDGVADIDIAAQLRFHQQQGRQATITGVVPRARYGGLDVAGTQVRRFTEKPAHEGGLINGGFFVLEPAVLERIAGDATIWEKEPLEELAQTDQLTLYAHEKFWHPMDTLRDRQLLEEMWAAGQAPWKIWRD